MNRLEIKNRIAFKIWTAVPGEERYKIGAVGQNLETIGFIPFRDDSIMRGQSNIRRFIYERSVTNIRDWSLAYSFTCLFLTEDVDFGMSTEENKPAA